MKKINYKYILMALAISLLGACDVLDQEPKNDILSEVAVVDAQSARVVRVGMYDNLQSGSLYGGEMILAAELMSKNAIATGFQAFWSELSLGRVPKTNSYVENVWVATYRTINTANTLITTVPDLTDLSTDGKNQILGEAHFVRGLMFFDLLKQFGEFENLNSNFGIPLKFNPVFLESTVAIPRSSVEESFKQIEDDLKEGIRLMNNSGNKFFASKNAAQALLARVHLFQKEYEEAEELATAVIEDMDSLVVPYNNIYTNEGNEESIFEIDFIQLVDANSLGTTLYSNPAEVSTRGALIEFFEDRGEIDRVALFEESGSNFRCTKYGNAEPDDGGNVIVLRLSEMYLIRAEAKGLKSGGNTTDGLDDINVVRNRADLPDLDAVDIDTESELKDVLLAERRAEFAFEGHYWSDLVRYDRFERILGLDAFRRRLPIPNRELIQPNNLLVQNPGY